MSGNGFSGSYYRNPGLEFLASSQPDTDTSIVVGSYFETALVTAGVPLFDTVPNPANRQTLVFSGNEVTGTGDTGTSCTGVCLYYVAANQTAAPMLYSDLSLTGERSTIRDALTYRRLDQLTWDAVQLPVVVSTWLRSLAAVRVRRLLEHIVNKPTSTRPLQF